MNLTKLVVALGSASAVALSLVLAVLVAPARAQSPFHCAAYVTRCEDLACHYIGTTSTCTFDSVTKNFTNVRQDLLILGNCYPGSGNCVPKAYTCTSYKYFYTDPTKGDCPEDNSWVCRDPASFTGCK